MSNDDRGAALQANMATYRDLDELAYINGAPHLKHTSIGQIYRSLVAEAIAGLGLDAREITVLELGAGNGLGSIPWLERNVKLTVIDSSEEMLRDYSRRAAAFGSVPRAITADVFDYLASAGETFDVVTHVSMLHHIPDYVELLRLSTKRVAVGGSLLTFQDPLRYDRMPAGHHLLDRSAYFAWRLGQGNYRRGLKTRWRRFRGVYSTAQAVDFDEYHVVRNGVDSEAILGLLRSSFADVREVRYWSTYSRLLQGVGERLKLSSSFGVVATSKRGTGDSAGPARSDVPGRQSQ